MRRRLIFFAALALVLAAACGDKPTTPTPTPTPTPVPTDTSGSSECFYIIGDVPAGDIPAAGGEFAVGILSPAGCTWAAISSAPFVTIVGAATGSGSGTVNFAIAANTGPSRQAAIQVGNRALTVSQAAGAAAVAGCEFSLDPASASVGAGSGTVSVGVTRTSGTSCPWTAVSNAAFITVQSGASGSDNGTTVLAVTANAGAARTGTATIAGRIVSIAQASTTPATCLFSVTPTSVSMPASGGTAPITLTLASGVNCAWSATPSSGFITVSSGSGIGSATITITVAPNTGGARSGTLTVAGQVVTLNQSGAVAAPGTTAVLSYQSELGEYIGSGLANSFPLSSADFQIDVNPSQSNLHFRMLGNGFWDLTLKSGSGTLVPGTYNNAARTSFAPAGTPGLDLNGDGRGCSQVTGRFLVQTAVFSGSSVQRFHARFEQHCEGSSLTLRGQIWFDAAGGSPPALADFPTPPATPVTQVTYTSDAGDFIGKGASGSFTLAGMKFSAWLSPNHPAVQIVAQSVPIPTTNWNLSFSAASGTQLLPGTYTGATRYPFNTGVPGLSVTANASGCNNLTGSFVVLEAVYGPQGEVLRFHATFEQHCEGALPALRGEVWIIADPWR